MCRFFMSFFVTLFFCHCPLLLALVLGFCCRCRRSSHFIHTNLHVEIIVNHMFYEHQSCLFMVEEKKINDRLIQRLFFVVVGLFVVSAHIFYFVIVTVCLPLPPPPRACESMIMCYFITVIRLFGNDH